MTPKHVDSVAATLTAGDASAADPKLRALTETIAAVGRLNRTEQLDVLRAAANFFGLVVILETPK